MRPQDAFSLLNIVCSYIICFEKCLKGYHRPSDSPYTTDQPKVHQKLTKKKLTKKLTKSWPKSWPKKSWPKVHQKLTKSSPQTNRLTIDQHLIPLEADGAVGQAVVQLEVPGGHWVEGEGWQLPCGVEGHWLHTVLRGLGFGDANKKFIL